MNTPSGYEVAQPPVTGVQIIPGSPQVIGETFPAAVTAPMPEENGATNMAETIPVNIPDNKGGYKTIIIKKLGSGYTGPQGEFYSEFPKVAQLKIIYGK